MGTHIRPDTRSQEFVKLSYIKVTDKFCNTLILNFYQVNLIVKERGSGTMASGLPN